MGELKQEMLGQCGRGAGEAGWRCIFHGGGGRHLAGREPRPLAGASSPPSPQNAGHDLDNECGFPMRNSTWCGELH